jgi:hypothetical protein
MRYTLRAYLQAGLEPRAALALAGRVLADRTIEHFATVVVGVYDTGEGRLTYASAGHPPPILLGLQTREPLDVCASPPIGWTVPTGRRQTTVSLPRGAVACFYTDGLIEARCGDELLGQERLTEIVAELGARPDAPKLLARVRTAALATPDDMAACILVPQKAGVAARTHIEELEADEQMLERGQLRHFLETCLLPAAAVEHAVDQAGEIAAVSGTALARVELAPRSATVTVTAPPPSVQAAAGGSALRRRLTAAARSPARGALIASSAHAGRRSDRWPQDPRSAAGSRGRHRSFSVSGGSEWRYASASTVSAASGETCSAPRRLVATSWRRRSSGWRSTT